MVQPVNIAAIEAATETTWQEWCAALQAAGADRLDHAEIAGLVRSLKPISGWWAQGVTVAYEQHIGRRLPRQMKDGTFSASLSRRVAGGMADLHEKWHVFAAGLPEIAGQKIVATPTTSATPKRQYWRCKLDDGSRVEVRFEPVTNEKTLIAVEHLKLPDTGATDTSKAAWAMLLTACYG